MGTWICLGVPWCVEVLNTDCADYTDAFYGDVDIPLCSVVRRGSEHGLHGLHGFFSGDLRIPLGSVMCEVLNTDYTDYTDSFYGDVDIP